MAARRPQPSMGEIGATGTSIFGNLLSQNDYNVELQTPQLYEVIDKMRKGDGQIAAVLRVMKLPLVNADWKIEKASDSPLDRMIAEVIEEDFFGGMELSFNSWLRQALLHLDFGCMPFEQNWRLDDSGLIRLKNLAPRLPRTVQDWLVDDKGKLTGIRQLANSVSTPIDIPADKLLLFVNDQEGGDYRGVSILRSAVKHWRYVDGLERVAAIGAEKRALGIDHGIIEGEGATAERQRDLERALMGMHAHEKNYIVTVKDQSEYKLEGIQGDVIDPLPLIVHHNLQILRSVLVEFVGMGAGSTGSLAMHRDKTSWVLLCLGGIADAMCDTVRQQLFQRWVDYNWLGATAPKLRYSRLEQRDVAVFADAVEKLASAGALTPDDTLEEESRDLLSLPEREGPAAPVEPIPEEVQNMPTESLIAAKRTLNAVLRARRRETETINAG
jgi:hypothetical protein